MAVTIKKVGVIGSGQMGNGIAHVAALAGFDVVLNDLSDDRLKSAMATINGNLSRQVQPGGVELHLLELGAPLPLVLRAAGVGIRLGRVTHRHRLGSHPTRPGTNR